MIARKAAAATGLIAAGATLAWLLFIVLPGWYAAPAPGATASAPPPTVDPARKIKARLFYLTEDGRSLSSIDQDVPFADTPTEQARAIILAQIATPEAPLVSAVPPGTTLRALFVTDHGD